MSARPAISKAREHSSIRESRLGLATISHYHRVFCVLSTNDIAQILKFMSHAVFIVIVSAYDRALVNKQPNLAVYSHDT